MALDYSFRAGQRFVGCLLFLVIFFYLYAAAGAATIEKANNATNLSSSSSWVGGALPGSFDSAVWDSTLSGSSSASVGGNFALGQLVVLNPAGPVTLTTPGTLTLNGVGGVGIDMSAATQNLTLNCPVTLGGGQTWNVAAGTTLTASGGITGGFGLTIAGGGTTVLSTSNIFADLFAGSITVIGGTLKFVNYSPVGDIGPTAIMPGATFDLSGQDNYLPGFALSVAGSGVGGNGAIVNSTGTAWLESTLTLAADATIGGSSPWSFYPRSSNAISGNGYDLTKTGSNVISFVNGGSVVGLRNIIINSGVLDVSNVSLDNSKSGSIIVNPGGTLSVGTYTSGATTQIQKPIILAGGVLETTTSVTNILAVGISLDSTGTFAPVFHSTLTIAGVISDGTASNGVVLAGDVPSELLLQGNNTYTGNTLISSGALALGSPLALQDSTLNTSGRGTVAFGALTAATIGGLTGTGSLALANTNSNPVALSVGNNNASTTYSGALSGLGSLTKIGSGELTLAGANTYGGHTLISGGTLSLANSLALQNSTLDTSGSGSWDFESLTAATIGGLTNSGALNIASSSLSLSVGNNNSNTTFSGAIGGLGSLIKIGSGTLTMTGTNTYSGATAINQGALIVNGSLASPVTVNSGGTLGGVGSLTSATVNAGGVLAPGDPPGTLSLGGGLSLVSGAVLDFTLDTPLTSDAISMPLGTLLLNDQQFTDFNFAPTSNFGQGTYTLIDAGSIEGSLGSGTSGIIDGLPATLAVQGDNLTLNVVPEPGTLALAAAALGLLAGTGRAFRKK